MMRAHAFIIYSFRSYYSIPRIPAEAVKNNSACQNVMKKWQVTAYVSNVVAFIVRKIYVL